VDQVRQQAPEREPPPGQPVAEAPWNEMRPDADVAERKHPQVSNAPRAAWTGIRASGTQIRADHVLVLGHRFHDPQRFLGILAERALVRRPVELVVPALVGAEDGAQPRTILHPDDEAAVGELNGDQLGGMHRVSRSEVASLPGAPCHWEDARATRAIRSAAQAPAIAGKAAEEPLPTARFLASGSIAGPLAGR